MHHQRDEEDEVNHVVQRMSINHGTTIPIVICLQSLLSFVSLFLIISDAITLTYTPST